MFQEQLLRINEKQFLGGLVFKARRLLCVSTLIMKKNKMPRSPVPPRDAHASVRKYFERFYGLLPEKTRPEFGLDD